MYGFFGKNPLLSSSAVLLFWPSRLGHLKIYLFCLSKQRFSGSEYPKKKHNFKNRSTAPHMGTSPRKFVVSSTEITISQRIRMSKQIVSTTVQKNCICTVCTAVTFLKTIYLKLHSGHYYFSLYKTLRTGAKYPDKILASLGNKNTDTSDFGLKNRLDFLGILWSSEFNSFIIKINNVWGD